jgi:hypothetical protein
MKKPDACKLWIVALMYAVVTAIAPAQTFRSLAFDGTNGSNPVSAPVQGLDANFYGTTNAGGYRQQRYGIQDHPGRDLDHAA